MKANTHAKADIYLFNPFSLNFIVKSESDEVQVGVWSWNFEHL
jgi:hypothetical protein